MPGFRGPCSNKRRIPNKCWGLLATQSCQEYQPYTSHVIATPTLSGDTDNYLFLAKQVNTNAEN